MTQALNAGAELALGIDHPVYNAAIESVPAAVRSSLLQDLQG
jgi:hypothetical protein